MIDTLATARAAGPESTRADDVFTAWLGERFAAEARHLFVAAQYTTVLSSTKMVDNFVENP